MNDLSKLLDEFKFKLQNDEKSDATIEKYCRDVAKFISFLGKEDISKENTIKYKQYLINQKYALKSVNSMIASLSSFLEFIGRIDCKIKSIKMQKQIFCEENRELTREEFNRLVSTAESNGNERLSLIIQTICGTGIRISELKFITVEAVRAGEAVVSCKGKTRTVFIVQNLRRKLMKYISKRKLKSGTVFITKSGEPVNRSSIWREMKNLCRKAEVNPEKVFPHNLRHLFARVFYAIEKDIAKLADILGHSSINTTRIYIISTGKEHRQRMESMRLIETSSHLV